jgi:hypothetical protein
VSARQRIQVPPENGPFASLGAELGMLDACLDSVDALAEADTGPKHARKDVLAAGQAAVNVVNGRRGRTS